jgi:ribonuclease E
MLDTEPTGTTGALQTSNETTSDTPAGEAAAAPPRRRRAASRPAGPPQPVTERPDAGGPAEPAQPVAAAPKRRRASKKAATGPAQTGADEAGAGETGAAETGPDTTAQEPSGATPRKRTRKKATSRSVEDPQAATEAAAGGVTGPLFQAPEVDAVPRRRAAAKAAARPADGEDEAGDGEVEEAAAESDAGEGGARRTRSRRGGRGRRGSGHTGGPEEGTEVGADDTAEAAEDATEAAAGGDEETGEGEEGGTRRRRRRRRRSSGSEEAVTEDDPPNTVVRVRQPRKKAAAREEDVRSVKGSTRLEAKKQRRREGRDAGRRRSTIITEAEFLARREAVDRVMAVRQQADRTQIAVLEDGVLVEHYINTGSAQGLVGNVYLGKVQNVLPSMEAAFVDIGKGRNAVLYAGEVNWDAAGLDGQPKRIELALKSGDSVLVQVTKDPMGHKGARLTSQISLAGRYLVYVPGGSMTGISRKLPDTERSRLKTILKKVVPDEAGVIVRTAAEGASEDELARDVARLSAQWEDIEKKAKKSSAPSLLYGEPDLTIRVVRDIFNEDFGKLVVSGDDAWEMLEPYVGHVAPDLRERLSRWTDEEDIFSAHRVDEQISKALDRKVWLPSGGYLVIDRTEAMVVIDVNTGKFTGSGGNLEETVTKNNLEAAEEVVRQLRLRDIGGIIVIDFIDMVLESNRELVLRRLVECLGRDRTKHQVAEVTSLGLVQMTRKRVGQGLIEAFSETCDCCNGRGVKISSEPVDIKPAGDERRGGRGRRDAPDRGRDKPAAKHDSGSSDVEEPAQPEVASAPAAVEDPVEAPTLGSDPVEEVPTSRRRRRAASG